jgi:hypothetical protein
MKQFYQFINIRAEYRALKGAMRVDAGNLRAIPLMAQRYQALIQRVEEFHFNGVKDAGLNDEEKEDWENIIDELDIALHIGQRLVDKVIEN